MYETQSWEKERRSGEGSSIGGTDGIVKEDTTKFRVTFSSLDDRGGGTAEQKKETTSITPRPGKHHQSGGTINPGRGKKETEFLAAVRTKIALNQLGGVGRKSHQERGTDNQNPAAHNQGAEPFHLMGNTVQGLRDRETEKKKNHTRKGSPVGGGKGKGR